METFKIGDRVHVSHTLEGVGFSYEGTITSVNPGISEPFYLVSGCSYPLPHSSLSETWEASNGC